MNNQHWQTLNSQTLNYQTLISGPTPHGGDYSILYWKDAQGRPIAQAQAMQVEIREFSALGQEIKRTQAFLDTLSLEAP
jgi:hypothetical protein